MIIKVETKYEVWGYTEVELPEGKTSDDIKEMYISERAKKDSNLPGWNSPQQAWAQTQGQLAWYKAMEDLGEMVQITNAAQLNRHLELWENDVVSKIILSLFDVIGSK